MSTFDPTTLINKTVSLVYNGHKKTKRNLHMEKVSVIIPSYNRANLIERSVQSVLNQTYKNIQYIIDWRYYYVRTKNRINNERYS